MNPQITWLNRIKLDERAVQFSLDTKVYALLRTAVLCKLISIVLIGNCNLKVLEILVLLCLHKLLKCYSISITCDKTMMTPLHFQESTKLVLSVRHRNSEFPFSSSEYFQFACSCLLTIFQYNRYKLLVHQKMWKLKFFYEKRLGYSETYRW